MSKAKKTRRKKQVVISQPSLLNVVPAPVQKGKKVHDTASSLSAYLREIGGTPLLTGAQERELSLRIQAGDEEARDHMMRANLRLVVNVAKKYAPRNEPDMLLDLIQEGNIGLMRAVARFKSEFKTRFSTYGVYWIRQAILRALKSRRLIRLPENVVDRVFYMQRTRQKLYQILGRDPVTEELAKEMKLTRQEVDQLEGLSADIVSLETIVHSEREEGKTELQDLLTDTLAVAPQELAQASFSREQVRSAVATLPPRERRIIDARFGLTSDDPKTLEQIGEDFGISRERVRQLQNVAFHRLKRRHGIQQAHV